MLSIEYTQYGMHFAALVTRTQTQTHSSSTQLNYLMIDVRGDVKEELFGLFSIVGRTICNWIELMHKHKNKVLSKRRCFLTYSARIS